jgi:serine phosphatase RsbU (regulator of sigma subunit)
MGAQVSLALSNAAYVSTRVAQERASRELQIAHDVQKRLLPQSIVPLAGFDIAGSSAAAREVGGDYFDVLPLSDHEIGFVVADVSGNGTSAAFYMAELQGMIRATASLLPSPAALLAQINRAMSGVLSRNVFITAVYGRLSDRGQVSLARAGHNPPIILRADGEIEAVSPPGAGIGVLRDQRFEDNLDTVTLSLAPGDLMAIYTDGIVEARNTEGEEYDIQRLTAVLRRNAASSSSAIHDAVLRDVASFTGLDVVQDDQTLLVIKRMSPTN